LGRVAEVGKIQKKGKRCSKPDFDGDGRRLKCRRGLHTCTASATARAHAPSRRGAPRNNPRLSKVARRAGAERAAGGAAGAWLAPCLGHLASGTWGWSNFNANEGWQG
jgi:hypothetical protein